ncbi:hypothetical protein KU735_23525, partial [Salmonella enterica subsp. enterica serovar Give]|nr:hypothetical protein [Salmonella enterica subsp. enterica serovar Give]
AYQQEDQRGNGRRQTEVLTAAAFKGDTVGVADEQIGITGRRGVNRGGWDGIGLPRTVGSAER